MKQVSALVAMRQFAWVWWVLASIVLGAMGGAVGARVSQQYDGISVYWFVGSTLTALVLLFPVPFGFKAMELLGKQGADSKNDA